MAPPLTPPALGGQSYKTDCISAGAGEQLVIFGALGQKKIGSAQRRLIYVATFCAVRALRVANISCEKGVRCHSLAETFRALSWHQSQEVSRSSQGVL